MSETTPTPSAPESSMKDKDFGADRESKPRGRRRRKVSYLTINKIYSVDYKDLNILRRYVNDRGKMLPSRQTGTTAKEQRMVARAVRRARELALLPYVVTEFSADRREMARGGPRQRSGGRRPEPPVQAAEAPVEAPVQAPVQAPAEASAEAPTPAVAEETAPESS